MGGSESSQVFVAESEEILTDLSKVTLKGAEGGIGFAYFKPSYATEYRLYGSDPEEYNEEFFAEIIDIDSTGYNTVVEPVPGKVYLLSISHRAGKTNEIATIRPVHEHECGQGIITEEPTAYDRGVRAYYCIHCGILIKREYIKRLEGSEDLGNPSGPNGLENHKGFHWKKCV